MSAPREDATHMRRALALARRGWGQTAPNPMVGAVVVRDGHVVGEGYHSRFGAPHAETEALAAAGERAGGSTVYVTLEPCAHVGKTPPCTDALIAAGVRRVVIATPDPSPVAAGGAEQLRRAGISVTPGVEEERARELNAIFFHALESPRPWVTLKLATSLDGAIADARGVSRWITGPRARRAAHTLRAGHDAVAVGIGTVLQDDPSLTVRGVRPPRVAPWRVVFDRHARLPLDSALARSASELPTMVVAADPPAQRVVDLERHGVVVLRAPSLSQALLELRRRNIRSLLVEGGARLAGAFVESALVNRLIIFQAPLLLGADALNAFAFVPAAELAGARRFAPVKRRKLGADLMTIYAPRES